MPIKRADEIRIRHAAIAGDLLTLETAEESEENSLRFEALTSEWDQLDEELKPLVEKERKLDAVRTRMAEEQNREPGFRAPDLVLGRTSTDPFRDLPESLPMLGGSELSTRAASALDVFAKEIPGAGTELIGKMLEYDPTSATAQFVLATSDPAYRSAFHKWLKDPIDGRTTWTREEALAYQRTYSVRAALSLTPANGGYMVPFTLDPTVILTNTGAVNPYRTIATVWTTSTKRLERRHVSRGHRRVDRGRRRGRGRQPHRRAAEDHPGEGRRVRVRLLRIPRRLGLRATVPRAARRRQGPAGGGRVRGRHRHASAEGCHRRRHGPGAHRLGDRRAAAGRRVRTAERAPRSVAQPTVPAGVAGVAARHQRTAAAAKVHRLYRLPGRRLVRHPTDARQANPGVEQLLLDPHRDQQDLAYGDLSQYYIVDRVGVQVIYDPLVLGATRRPTGQAGYYAFWRTGGDAAVAAALRVLTLAA